MHLLRYVTEHGLGRMLRIPIVSMKLVGPAGFEPATTPL